MRIVFPREVLLVEVERWCREPTCGARARLSLTKKAARAYTGYECERCGRWFWDTLSARDIPEWWREFNGAAPELPKPVAEAPKPAPEPRVPKPAPEPARVNGKAGGRVGAGEEADDEDVGEVVARMSEAWRQMGGEPESVPGVAEAERGDSS